jgi:uncharacterized protein YbjT (DUF2867 family)
VTCVRIAVTGSTGTVGSQVVSLLAASAGPEIVALARRPEAVAARLGEEVWRSGRVSAVRGDYDDPGSLVAALASGELRVPAGQGRVSLVSRSDVGRCLAALALLPPSGRAHDLTGPVSLSLDAVAEVLGGIAGRVVRYTDVPPPVLAEELARAGEDPWWTYAYSGMFASVRQDRWGGVSDEVLRLTGRAPAALDVVVRVTA